MKPVLTVPLRDLEGSREIEANLVIQGHRSISPTSNAIKEKKNIQIGVFCDI